MDKKQYFDWLQHYKLNQENPDYMRLHAAFADRIIKEFAPRRLLDIGAGTGAMIEHLNRSGVEAWGYSNNPFEKMYYDGRKNPDRYRVFDIAYFGANYGRIQKAINQLPFQYDVITAIESFEHFTMEEIRIMARFISNRCEWFIFSSTSKETPEDLEFGHINVKHAEYWKGLFEGQKLRFVKMFGQPTEWTMLFKSA